MTHTLVVNHGIRQRLRDYLTLRQVRELAVRVIGDHPIDKGHFTHEIRPVHGDDSHRPLRIRIVG